MSHIESPTKTIEKFIPSWRYTKPDRLREELISTFNETHRKPDEYKFRYKNGILLDFQTDTEIKINTSSYLGQKDAYRKIRRAQPSGSVRHTTLSTHATKSPCTK